MLKRAGDNGLEQDQRQKLEELVVNHLEVFCIGLAAGEEVKCKPLKIKLMADTKPVRFKLRNYSQAQREFISDFFSGLTSKGMAYRNPSFIWEFVP